MAGFSDYLEDKVLNWLRGTAMGTAPSALFVGLFSAAPSDAGGGTEITAAIRPLGRPAVSFAAPSQVSGSARMANDAIVNFGDAQGSANATHFGIFDSFSGGNLLAWNALASSRSITPGDVVRFTVGSLTISID